MGIYMEKEFLSLKHYLREEIKFPDLNSLINQMEQDKLDAKIYFLNDLNKLLKENELVR
jgi:FAD synthase